MDGFPSGVLSTKNGDPLELDGFPSFPQKMGTYLDWMVFLLVSFQTEGWPQKDRTNAPTAEETCMTLNPGPPGALPNPGLQPPEKENFGGSRCERGGGVSRAKGEESSEVSVDFFQWSLPYLGRFPSRA